MPEHRYEMIIYWSQADGAFLVEVPELPGCMADGPTYEAAVANAQVIIREWIDTATSLPAPRPRSPGNGCRSSSRGYTQPRRSAMTTHTIDLQLALPRSLVERITRTAEANRTSVADVIATTVDHALPLVPALPPTLLRELLAMLDYSDGALHTALRPTISPTDDRRLRELTGIAKIRRLSTDEALEQARLLEVSEWSMIRRAQALAILRRRGYDVPSAQEVFEDEDVLG